MSGNGTGRKRGAASTARRELVENELYEHATRLFAERGFAGTSLQDIADALGITRPALYYYVKSKDELLAKLVTEVTQGPLDELQKIAAAGASFAATAPPLDCMTSSGPVSPLSRSELSSVPR